MPGSWGLRIYWKWESTNNGYHAEEITKVRNDFHGEEIVTAA
ncbi:hypothetical protein LEP1GSC195_2257 [Leptospira wolbachii serovar Codice str. CDC]|uniref:Uncharacterized protein n=1 Tax=Leptospira wolbachii serovar Codice str. CDC TaxID=1218599 RepID=R9A5N9_9LEPT|nr:hypothetical protein LEP1GSC195_2257 [Leptospira wolbachii serovar Codice str. CDC]